MNNTKSIKIYYYGWCPYCNQGWYVFKSHKSHIYIECEECTTQPALDADITPPTFGNLLSVYADYKEIIYAKLKKYLTGFYEAQQEEVNLKYAYELFTLIFDPLPTAQQSRLYKLILDLSDESLKVNFKYLDYEYNALFTGVKNILQVEEDGNTYKKVPLDFFISTFKNKFGKL